MRKIEQVKSDGTVELAEDTILSQKQIHLLLTNLFGEIKKEKTGGYSIKFDGRVVNIFIKNITYLGFPHPSWKKRIQVSARWSQLLHKNNTVLMGVYSYKGNTLFAFFSVKKRGKNSSAHISSFDLIKATELGVFEKIDAFDNRVVVCQIENVSNVLENLLREESLLLPELQMFKDFAECLKLNPRWVGIECYKRMIQANFSQKFQAEWAGFYHEFLFEDYLKKDENFSTICRLVRTRRDNDDDLDLEFPRRKHRGDLKTHTKGMGIQGNDKLTVLRRISIDSRLWYVALEHDTDYDKNHNCVTAKFWNQEKQKIGKETRTEDSYCARMKYAVSLTKLMILEINSKNIQYVIDYKQGRNSDGKPRATKIAIPHKALNNFLLAQFEIES